MTEALVRNMETCRPDIAVNRSDGQSKRGRKYAGSGEQTGEAQAADLQG